MVDQGAELGRADADHVADLVGEALARRVADPGSGRTGCPGRASGRPDTGARRSSVCATRSTGSRLIRAMELAPSRRNWSGPLTSKPTSAPRTSSRLKVVVEQAHERPDGAGGVVVLGLGEQQGAAALEVAQVDVVAEAGPDDGSPREAQASTISGSGLFHTDLGCRPICAPQAHGRHRLGLGEDLGVGADADFQILRPEARADQHAL